MEPIYNIAEETLIEAKTRNLKIEVQPGGVNFAPYTNDPTIKRQLFWLSYTSLKIKEFAKTKSKILDIGSNIYWLMGIASSYNLTMIDVREHPLKSIFPFELITANATSIPVEREHFDVVTFPQLLHWVGTTTYGDTLNINGDKETLAEVARILKPGGIGIFTTIIVPSATTLKIGGRRLFNFDDLSKMIKDVGLDFIDLSIRDTKCEAIEKSKIPEISNNILNTGNPDEDLAWLIATVRKVE